MITIPSTTLPASFLLDPLPAPPTLTPVRFKPVLPRYDGCYAAVADNVLSPAECEQLLAAAAAHAGKTGWERATVNSYGTLVLDERIRRCDRIMWDQHEVVSRVWARCAPLFQRDIGVLDGSIAAHNIWGCARGQKWALTRPNERMRILRYGPGEFFAPHMDGVYVTPDEKERSFFTLHLYLNDGEHQDGAGPLKGGATSFMSHWNPKTARKIPVQPKMGSVLVFQHKDLVHAGDELESGLKYTLRTDLMYEKV